MSESEELSTSTYWDNRYRDDRSGWDLGAAPQWIQDLAQGLPAQDVLVVGAGNGHDAAAFAQAGHRVVGVDFAPRAIAGATQRYGNMTPGAPRFVQADLFALGDSQHPQMRASFDRVWEQTLLCAIDPERRGDYFAAVSRVLRPQGRWHAVIWSHGEPGGPPFHLTPEIVETLVPAGWTRVYSEPLEHPSNTRPGQHLVEYSA